MNTQPKRMGNCATPKTAPSCDTGLSHVDFLANTTTHLTETITKRSAKKHSTKPIKVKPHGNTVVRQTNVSAEDSTIVLSEKDNTDQALSASAKVTPMDKELISTEGMPFRAAAIMNPNLDGKIIGMSMDDHNNHAFVPDSNTFLIKEDEMSSEFFTGQPNLLYMYSVPEEAEATPIATFPVTPYPRLHTLIATNPSVTAGSTFVPTMLESYAMLFRRWRGSLVYKFKLVSSNLITVKIVATLKYGVISGDDGITNYETALADPAFVMDFDSENREHVLRVPFFDDQEMLYNPLQPNTDINDCKVADLSIVQLTNVSTRGTASSGDVKLQVWISASNMEFADYTMDDTVIAMPRNIEVSPPEVIPRKVDPHFGEAFGITANTTKEVRDTMANDKVQLSKYVVPVDLASLAAKWEYAATIFLDKTTANGRVYEFKLPQDIITSHVQYAIAACAYFRGDMVFRILPTTSAFYGGQIIVAFQPLFYPIDEGLSGSDLYARLTSLKHMVIDLSSTQPMTFTIPYRHWGQAYKSSDFGTHGGPKAPPVTGTLHFYLIDFQAPDDTTKGITLNIQRSWTNFEPYITRGVDFGALYRNEPVRVKKQFGSDPENFEQAERDINMELVLDKLLEDGKITEEQMKTMSFDQILEIANLELASIQVVPHGPIPKPDKSYAYDRSAPPSDPQVKMIAENYEHVSERSENTDSLPQEHEKAEHNAQAMEHGKAPGFQTAATSNQQVVNTDEIVETSLLHASDRIVYTSTPQNMVELVRRPVKIKGFAGGEWQFQFTSDCYTYFANIDKTSPFARLSRMYGAFCGNITFTTFTWSNGSGYVNASYVPFHNDPNTDAPTLAQLTTSIYPQLSVPITISRGTNSSTYNFPFRCNYRYALLDRQINGGDPVPVAQAPVIWGTPVFWGNTNATTPKMGYELYFQAGDGFRFGLYIGSPRYEFSGISGKLGFTTNIKVTDPPPAPIRRR